LHPNRAFVPGPLFSLKLSILSIGVESCQRFVSQLLREPMRSVKAVCPTTNDDDLIQTVRLPSNLQFLVCSLSRRSWHRFTQAHTDRPRRIGGSQQL